MPGVQHELHGSVLQHQLIDQLTDIGRVKQVSRAREVHRLFCEALCIAALQDRGFTAISLWRLYKSASESTRLETHCHEILWLLPGRLEPQVMSAK